MEKPKARDMAPEQEPGTSKEWSLARVATGPVSGDMQQLLVTLSRAMPVQLAQRERDAFNADTARRFDLVPTDRRPESFTLVGDNGGVLIHAKIETVTVEEDPQTLSITERSRVRGISLSVRSGAGAIVERLDLYPAPPPLGYERRRMTVVESPLAGNVHLNESYARLAVLDCYRRGEAPFASHLLGPLVLDDSVPAERAMGMEAGWVPYDHGALCAVYCDLGMSRGMAQGIARAKERGCEVVHRCFPSLTREVLEEGGPRLDAFALVDSQEVEWP